jgi:hypothetical protein
MRIGPLPKRSGNVERAWYSPQVATAALQAKTGVEDRVVATSAFENRTLVRLICEKETGIRLKNEGRILGEQERL